MIEAKINVDSGMFDFFWQSFVIFAVTVDPIGLVPFFLAVTLNHADTQRSQIAFKATLIAAGILVAFAVVGEQFLNILGIGLPALRIAGGILLFLVAIDMLLVRESGLRSTVHAEMEEASIQHNIAVFPLAIPLIAGPGAITSTILLMGRTGSDFTQQTLVIVALFFVLAFTLLLFIGATKVQRFLGLTGINVVTRVMGIILASLACQFVIDGIKESW